MRNRLWLAISATILLTMSMAVPLSAQHNQDDYDEVDPWSGVTPALAGPDSAAVAGFLAALSLSQPVVCQLAVSAVGNNWSHWGGDYATGMLQGEGGEEAARQAINRPV